VGNTLFSMRMKATEIRFDTVMRHLAAQCITMMVTDKDPHDEQGCSVPLFNTLKVDISIVIFYTTMCLHMLALEAEYDADLIQ